MTAITKFDRAECRRLREGLERAVAVVAKGYGLSITVGGMSFTPENCTVKLEAAVLAPTGDVLSRERTDFERYAGHFGLTKEDFGATFRGQRGILYQIVGAKMGASKYPILAKHQITGKIFKFTAEQVKRGMLPKEPPKPAPAVVPPIKLKTKPIDLTNPLAGSF